MILNNLKKYATPCFIFILACCFYFATRTFQFTFDSIGYLVAAQSGSGHFYHPHHLIYSPFLRVFYLFFNNGLGWNVSIAFLGQVLNILFAVTGVFFVYHLCLIVIKNNTFSLFAATCTFFFFYYWSYATQGEVYTASVNCLLLCSYFLFAKELNKANIAGVIIFWSLAVLFHQTAVLFLFPLSYWFMRDGKVPKLLVICFFSGGIVATCYLAAIYSVYHNCSLQHIKNFVFEYYFHDEPEWGKFKHFSLEGLSFLWCSYQKAVVGPDIAGFFNRTLSVGLVVLAVIGVVECKAPYKTFFITWIVPQLLFALWWFPIEAEFLIISLPIFAIFCAIGLKRCLPQQVGEWVIILVGSIIVCLILIINLPHIRALMNPADDFVDKNNELFEYAPEKAIIGLKETMVNQLILFQYQKDRKYLRLEQAYEAVYNGTDAPRLFGFVKHAQLFVPLVQLCPNNYHAAGDFGQLSNGYQIFLKQLLADAVAGSKKAVVVQGKNTDYLFLSDHGGEVTTEVLIEKLRSGGYCSALSK